MQKRKFKQVFSLILSTMMICGMCLPQLSGTNVAAAPGKAKNYIIVAKSKKAMGLVKTEYRSLIDEQDTQNTDLLKDENIIVSKMTPNEAKMVEEDSKVKAVEEDINVNASTTETSNKEVEVYKKANGKDSFWNLKSIGVDKNNKKSSSKVKVALLDSGVDFQEGLDVKERMNLIADDEEFSPLFEDETNHGTSIASLLVSENKNGQVKGINNNIELYSARILDRNKQAPVSRVIEGIHWAVEKDVKIISISFGMDQYSEALKHAIDEANAKGILVVAAGNNGQKETKNVQYPAAFDNVVAVGSIDSQAKVSDFSSTGRELDVVAPGEAVRATGAFGETMITSGTSMSVPHVVGVASLIWQKDLSKPKDFVSQVLEESARPLGSKEKYGDGVVDYEYANTIYAQAEKQYNKTRRIDIKMNDSVVETYDNRSDEAKVEGTWSGTNHQKYLTDNNVNLPAMKKGASYPDSTASDAVGIARMTENPDFHGLYERRNVNNEPVNYLASYRFMIKIGNEYGKGKTYTAVAQSKIPGLTDNSYNKIRSAMSKIQKKSFFKNYSKANKKAFVFGVAMHTATDAFAHSTFLYYKNKWYSITHKNGTITGADDIGVQSRRFKMAYRIERNNLYRYQGKRTDVAVCHDFHAAGDTNGSYYVNDSTNKYYRIANISTCASKVHISDTNVIKHYGLININR